ncbi:hypothetical protein ABEP12_02235 [Bacillus velezensis]
MKEKGIYVGLNYGFGMLNAFKSLPDKSLSYKNHVVIEEKETVSQDPIQSTDFKTILKNELKKKNVY